MSTRFLARCELREDRRPPGWTLAGRSQVTLRSVARRFAEAALTGVGADVRYARVQRLAVQRVHRRIVRAGERHVVHGHGHFSGSGA